MDHRQVWKLLSPYRDNELDGPSREAVAAHVARCEECRSELTAWEALGGALFRRPPAPLPQGFSVRVMTRLAGRSAPAFDPLWLSLRRWLVPAFGAAMAAAALAILLPENESADATELLLLADSREDRGSLSALLSPAGEVDSYDEQLLEEP